MQIKYTIIVKVSKAWQGTTTGGAFWLKFKKVTDLVKFTDFLDKKYGYYWLYYNVMINENEPSLAHFTKDKRPTSKRI
jgi:hypothetical protein